MASSSFPGRVAYCSLNGATGAILSQSGDFASCAHPSGGTYNLTYQSGSEIDPLECVFLVTSRTGLLIPYVRAATDTTLGIKAVDQLDVGTDCNLDILIICKPAN